MWPLAWELPHAAQTKQKLNKTKNTNLPNKQKKPIGTAWYNEHDLSNFADDVETNTVPK